MLYFRLGIVIGLFVGLSGQLFAAREASDHLFDIIDNSDINNQSINHSSISYPRIIGGTRSQQGQFPWTVWLRANGKYRCGGSIIGPRHILTAAHCFTGSNRIPKGVKFEVLGGSVLRSQSVLLPKIAKITLHPEYDGLAGYKLCGLCDVAVVRLSRRIQFTERIKPILMMRSRQEGPQPKTYAQLVRRKTDTIVAGWGTINPEIGSPTPDYQSYIETRRFRVLGFKDISKFWLLSGMDFFNRPGVGSAYFAGRSTCDGDSGSGYFTYINDRPFLIGVGSASDCKGNTAYASVPYYRRWIVKTVRKRN